MMSWALPHGEVKDEIVHALTIDARITHGLQ